jgi:hypothetical protein
MKKILFTIFALISTSASAQVTDPCATATAPFVLLSGRPYSISWVQAPNIATSATDLDTTKYFIDGFSYSIDGGPKVDMTPKPVSGVRCPAGTPFAEHIVYTFAMPSGIAKGNHTLIIYTWNFSRTLDASNTIVVGTTRNEVASVSVPFVVSDPTVFPPPLGPKNPRVWR